MVAELILIPGGAAGLEPAKQCAQYVARGLSAIGIKVREQISLCNTKAELQKAVATALGRSNVVMTLGGLAKEQGYITKKVLSQGLGLALFENTACLEAIQAYCKRTGEPYTADDRSYAQLPQGSVAFPGQFGKLAGCAISSEKQHIIMMPDNQTEAAAMLNRYIVPYLSGNESQTTITRTLRTYGINAEQVRAILCELLDTANPAVTVDKEGNEVLVRVSAHASTGQQAASLCTPVLRSIVDRLGDAAYGLDVDSLESAVVGKLQKKQLDIAVAEAGIDGMLTRVLAETNGGSEVLRYSVSVDEDSMKTDRLRMDAKLLKKRGGVSEWAAVAMANGARERAGTHVAVAVCGNTTDEKRKKCPIGLVYIAVCDANTVYVKKLIIGSGDPMERDLVIDAAVSRALNMVRLFVDYLPRPYTGAIPIFDALNGRTVTDKESYDKDADYSNSVHEDLPKKTRFADNFVIRKSDETRIKVRKAIFILAMLVFLGSAGYVGKYYLDSFRAREQAKELQELFTFGEMGEDVEIAADYPKDYLFSFAGLWNINRDVVAYIDIEGTKVQYPIVQSEDNAYYLRRDFYEKSNQHGIPYMDYRSDVKAPSDNFVVYGHNMKDGQIFGEIIPYQKLEYYKEHPTINFSTVYEPGVYKVFAVFITNAYSAQGPVFDYHNFIDAKDDVAFQNFIDNVRIRSLLNIPVDVKPGDQLLTLSTCTYEFTEARFVVVARKVRLGEDEGVDVSAAVKNPQPLYPDIWYKTYGGTKPSGVPPMAQGQGQAAASSKASEHSAPPPSSSSASAAEPEVQSSQPQASQSPSSTAPPPSSAPSDNNMPAWLNPSSSQASPPAQQIEPNIVIPNDDAQEGPPQEVPAEDDDADRINLDLRRVVQVKPVSTDSLSFEFSDGTSQKASIKTQGTEPTLFDNLGMEPPGGNSKPSSQGSLGPRPSGEYVEELAITVGGKKVQMNTQEVLSRIVHSEMGSNFHADAVKAQAVAAYTYILFYNQKGQAPQVILADSAVVSDRVRNAVGEVLGQAVYYQNRIAFTPYHATSAGQTTSSQSVWGGSYPYLISVESPVDKRATKYKVAWSYPSETISQKLRDKLGIETFGDPGSWFEVLSVTDGNYNDRMSVCGETKSLKTGNVITGRMLREHVLGLRSANFTVDYDAEKDRLIFTTLGYGHGVGLSQNGANFYAQDGWNYVEILEHYYPGCLVG